MLQNRRFFVALQGKNSRWRKQKNGLAQGSVLAPILFNIYTNDQPIHPLTRMFIYADDTAVTAQGKTFEQVEENLNSALEDLATYYVENDLKPNPSKSQACAFHLKNRQAKRKLKITWRGQNLEHSDYPKYLGVTLDRALTFKEHCYSIKKKVFARNNILRKLTGSTWGAQPHVLRTSGLALSIAAAEYAAPVWRNSAHAKEVDVAVNETARIASGCLKPTPVEVIYPIVGIAPPTVRRKVAAETERWKQKNDPRHPMFGHEEQRCRLKSRKSFIDSTKELTTLPSIRRLSLWKEMVQHPAMKLQEEGADGFQLPYPTWKSLNRLRTGVTRCKSNLYKWGYSDNDKCECGATQNFDHLLICPNMSEACSRDDVFSAIDRALYVADYWKDI